MAQVKVTLSGPAAAVQQIINLLSLNFTVNDPHADEARADADHSHRPLQVEVPVGAGRTLLANGAPQLAQEKTNDPD